MKRYTFFSDRRYAWQKIKLILWLGCISLSLVTPNPKEPCQNKRIQSVPAREKITTDPILASLVGIYIFFIIFKLYNLIFSRVGYVSYKGIWMRYYGFFPWDCITTITADQHTYKIYSRRSSRTASTIVMTITFKDRSLITHKLSLSQKFFLLLYRESPLEIWGLKAPTAVLASRINMFLNAVHNDKVPRKNEKALFKKLLQKIPT